MADIQKEKIRNLVSSIYDIQKLRIATGNRIVHSFNTQMGQKPQTKQKDMEKEAAELIKELRSEYKRITDAYVDKQYSEVITSGESKNKRKNNYNTVKTSGKTKITKSEVDKDKLPKGVDKEEIKIITISKNASIDSVIKTMTTDENAGINKIKSKLDYELIGTYIDLLDTEERTSKILSKEVEKHPMWDAFFKDIKGCGPLMAAVCIAYFDIDKARHVSSFWKYAGLDTIDVVKEDGTVVNEGRAAKHAKFVEVEYVDKNNNIKTRHSIGYNPVLKSKLVGVLGGCLLKAGLRTVKDEDGNAILDKDGNKQQTAASVYVQCYLDYMHRLNNRADSKELTGPHKNAMANRYMIKMFIRDLWVTWREYEGYEVSKPYEVAKLGYKPHKYNEYHDRVAEQTKSRKAI